MNVRRTARAAVFLACLASAGPLAAADLSRLVRLKASAGDLASGEAAVDEYRRAKGTDADALDALGWLAREALLLGKSEKAWTYCAEVRRLAPAETDDTVIPLGAAIEVEGRLRAQRDGRGAALRFLEGELARARDYALRARIVKNVHLLSLEGHPAPELGGDGPRLASLRGRPVLLFLWAHGCGDCKAQAPILARLRKTYGEKLAFVAPTRLTGENDEWKPATESEERPLVAKDWAAFDGLAGIPTPVDTETMVRYGASATPTLVLVDRRGIVRLYTPTRMSETELSRVIDELLAEPA